MTAENKIAPAVDRLLLAYATGGLCPEEALAVAALLALDARARRLVATYEALGGRVLEEERPADVRCLDAVMKKIGCTAEARPAAPRMPEPLSSLLHGCARDDAACWQEAKKGFARIEVQVRVPAGGRHSVFLMRLSPHAAVPQHSHSGPEITVVLEGDYSDGFGHYGRGDVAVITDSEVPHSPRAGAAGCLCLVVTQGPWRRAGSLQRLLRLLSGMR